MGRTVGFVPETIKTPLDVAVAAEIEERLSRWVNWRLRILRGGAPPADATAIRRWGDGVTAFGLGPDHAARLLRWSQRAVDRKQARHPGGGGGGAAPDDLVALLDAVNREGVRSSVSNRTGEGRPGP